MTEYSQGYCAAILLGWSRGGGSAAVCDDDEDKDGLVPHDRSLSLKHARGLKRARITNLHPAVFRELLQLILQRFHLMQKLTVLHFSLSLQPSDLSVLLTQNLLFSKNKKHANDEKAARCARVS